MFSLLSKPIEAACIGLGNINLSLENVKSQAQKISQGKLDAEIKLLNADVDQLITRLEKFASQAISFTLGRHSFEHQQRAAETRAREYSSMLLKSPNFRADDFNTVVQQYRAQQKENTDAQQALDAARNSLDDEIEKAFDNLRKLRDEIREVDRLRQLFREKAQDVIVLALQNLPEEQKDNDTALLELKRAVDLVNSLGNTFGTLTKLMCKSIDVVLGEQTSPGSAITSLQEGTTGAATPREDERGHEECLGFADQLDLSLPSPAKSSLVGGTTVEVPSSTYHDKIHIKNLRLGRNEYRKTISASGNLCLVGSLPEEHAFQIISDAMKEADQVRAFRLSHGRGQQLIAEKPDPAFGISYRNITTGDNVELHIMAIDSLSPEKVHSGSGGMHIITTVFNFDAQREAKLFLTDINWTQYELVARPSSSFGDIMLKERDAMMIWSSDPIRFGGINAKDGSKLYVLKTTPQDFRGILCLMPSDQLAGKISHSSRCWAIVRQGTLL